MSQAHQAKVTKKGEDPEISIEDKPGGDGTFNRCFSVSHGKFIFTTPSSA